MLRRATVLSLSFAIVAFAMACEESTPIADAATPDAGVDAAAVPEGITRPAEAAPPMVEERPVCAAGFQLTTTTPAFCEPWPAGEGRCPDRTSARFPGDAACRPVGACPSGEFADDLPSTGVVYVRAGAAGDGSRGAPFGTIAAGIGASGRPGIVAIGPGVYAENLRVPAGISLIGTCPERSTIQSTTPGSGSAEAAVTIDGADAVLRGLAVTAPMRRGLRISRNASAHLEGVVVHDVYDVGISVEAGASLEAVDVIVADVASPAGSFGVGILYGSATVDLRRVLLEDISATAIFANGGGGELTAEALVVRGVIDDVRLGVGAIHFQDDENVMLVGSVIESVRSIFGVAALGMGATVRLEASLVRGITTPSGHLGSGAAQAREGATVSIVGSALRQSEGVSVWSSGAGSSVEVADSYVDSVAPSPDPSALTGSAVRGDDGGRLELRRTRITNAAGAGVTIGQGGLAIIEDVVVRGVPGIPEFEQSGRGVQVGSGAQATLSRVLIESVSSVGLYAGLEGTHIDGTDIVVRDVTHRGIALELSATGVLARVLVDESQEAGILSLAGAALTLSDAIVRGTRARDDGRFGRGINVQEATAELTRVHVDDYDEMGIFVAGTDTTATLRDVFVENGVGAPLSGQFGEGISAQAGGAVRGSRVAVEGAREVGILAIDGAAIELSQVDVRGTLSRACASSACTAAPVGHGVAAIDGTVRLADFESVDSEFCGVFVSDAGAMDLDQGRVAGAVIGVCLQVPDYDLSRLTDGVDYEDNGTNLDSTTLPVPSPAETIASSP